MNRLHDLLLQAIYLLSKRRQIVLTLSVVVVFVTTYLLILPAFTLEKDEAAEQGGIDVPGIESVSQDSAAEGDAAAAEESSTEEKASAATHAEEKAGEQSGNTDNEKNSSDTAKGESKKDKQSGTESKTEKSSEEASAGAVEETDPLTYEGEFYRIIVEDKANVLPDNTEIKVEEIIEEEDEESYKQYCDDSVQAINDDEKTPTVEDLKFARFYDIKLIADGTEIKAPEDAVSVRIEYDEELAASMNVDNPDSLRIVHFAENKETGEIEPEVLDSETVEVNTDKKDNLTDTTFEAESFSVYGVIYTVDFHWEVDGKRYDFSIPGGGYVTLQQLVEVLGIGNDKAASKETAEAEEDTPAETRLTLADVEISDRTKAFVGDVEKAEFSDPELAWVGKIDKESTVAGLKKANKLECQYSENLTEEQIDEINAQKVDAGDWALISLKPFTSNETLTITMKNGDKFVVKVTDAQDPSAYIGKEVIIYDNGEQRAMLSSGYTYYGQGSGSGRYRLNSIPLSEAEANDAAHWTVERNNNNYYLKASNGQYLTINGNDVGLVNNRSVATPLKIDAGTNPD